MTRSNASSCLGCHRVSRAPFCRACTMRLRPAVRSNPAQAARVSLAELASGPEQRLRELGFDGLQQSWPRGSWWEATAHNSRGWTKVLEWLPESLSFERGISMELLFWLSRLVPDAMPVTALSLRYNTLFAKYTIEVDLLITNIHLREMVGGTEDDAVYDLSVVDKNDGNEALLTPERLRAITMAPPEAELMRLWLQRDQKRYAVALVPRAVPGGATRLELVAGDGHKLPGQPEGLMLTVSITV